MNQVKKIGLLLLVWGLLAGFAQAAPADATVRFSGGSVAAGIGWSWGKGTLTYKGKDYPISVKGLSLGKVGITGVTASGEVLNLKKLRDFDGNYTAAGAGITLAGGRSVGLATGRSELARPLRSKRTQRPIPGGTEFSSTAD